MTKPYKDALSEARKAGAGKAAGDAELAQTCFALCKIHRGLNPSLLYDGAIVRGLSPRELVKWGGSENLDDVLELNNVMFDAPSMRPSESEPE